MILLLIPGILLRPKSGARPTLLSIERHILRKWPEERGGAYPQRIVHFASTVRDGSFAVGEGRLPDLASALSTLDSLIDLRTEM